MMKKTRYANVYQDVKGNFFFQVYLGRDDKGKQRFKKGRKDSNGRPFTSARAAHNEAIRIKNDALELSGKAIYRMKYGTFMHEKFIPKYKGDVEESTFETHKKAFEYSIERFGAKQLEDISVMDCEWFCCKVFRFFKLR